MQTGMILKVTPEVLHQKSNQTAVGVTELQKKFSGMNQAVMRSIGYWNGDGGEAHRMTFKNHQDRMDEILRRFGEHSRELAEMAQNYMEGDQTVQTIIEDLPFDVIR